MSRMRAVIDVNHIGKIYRLGEVGTGTLSHDLRRWWASITGRPDPFAKVGLVNDRSAKGGTNDLVWALKDVSFQVNQGDIVGVIGKNGAGKSTLLKIISRITAPTEGTIRVKGRIASLLEVGTGFHPEMTGRENIYMNGTVMGMRRHEIARKFDDIIDFAGVAKYVDTPTKRYSSGMTVRLAFSVAAFLEPEILVVDEVLAVGDAEFQKRALGKMKEVSSGQGRTVLFVSHNIGAIKSLCTTGLLLRNGRVDASGGIDTVVENYLADHRRKRDEQKTWISTCGRFELNEVFFTDQQGRRGTIFAFGESITLNFNFTFKQQVSKINIGFAVVNDREERIFTSHLSDDSKFSWPARLDSKVVFETKFNLRELAPGRYKLVFGVRDENETLMIYDDDHIYFDIDRTFVRESGNGILWHITDWQITSS